MLGTATQLTKHKRLQHLYIQFIKHIHSEHCIEWSVKCYSFTQSGFGVNFYMLDLTQAVSRHWRR